MEEVHGVDVSWLHHPNKGMYGCAQPLALANTCIRTGIAMLNMSNRAARQANTVRKHSRNETDAVGRFTLPSGETAEYPRNRAHLQTR